MVERACILFGGQVIGAEQAEQTIGRRRRDTFPDRATLVEELRASNLPAPFLHVIEDDPAEDETGIEVADIVAETMGLEGPVDLRNIVADVENRYITEALRAAEGVVSEAARLLSLKRTTLIEKMRKHGVAEAA